jgi:hypothetical protein
MRLIHLKNCKFRARFGFFLSFGNLFA